MANPRRVADDLVTVEEFYSFVADGRNPIQERVEFLVLEEGRYQLAPLEENRVFRSRALAGFWIDIDWLLANPLPPATGCLKKIPGTEQ